MLVWDMWAVAARQMFEEVKGLAITKEDQLRDHGSTYYQWCSAEIWTIRPTVKMQTQKLTDRRRPIRSAIGAAIRAPISVPMES